MFSPLKQLLFFPNEYAQANLGGQNWQRGAIKDGGETAPFAVES